MYINTWLKSDFITEFKFKSVSNNYPSLSYNNCEYKIAFRICMSHVLRIRFSSTNNHNKFEIKENTNTVVFMNGPRPHTYYSTAILCTPLLLLKTETQCIKINFNGLRNRLLKNSLKCCKIH